MKKIKEIFENVEEKIEDFRDEHPAILPILVSAVVSFITTVLFVGFILN